MRFLGIIIIMMFLLVGASFEMNDIVETHSKDYIKWMEFDVPYDGMRQAFEYDINSKGAINWIDLLAYTVSKNWGKYPGNGRSQEMDKAATRLTSGETIESIVAGLQLFPFYREAYGAVLDAMVGEYEVLIDGDKWERMYGLKAFFPLASGYSFSHFDDFGESRSYGYKRRHLGHDFMARTGTPVISVEDGYVEALGWNRYGGWRVGIRSVDQKRYYYYAHLRKDHPYHKNLSEGSFVKAGDVIGYVGMTGYSEEENVNNISTPHLHFGMQIIFDESQKNGKNQIWIDVYDIINLLAKNKMSVRRDETTRDFERTFTTNSTITD